MLTISKFNTLVGLILFITPVLIFIVYSGITLNFVSKGFSQVEIENKTINRTAFSGDTESTITGAYTIDKELPQFNIPTNSAATYNNKLIIPSIGLDTDIYESYTGELALDKGVWRMPDNGRPDQKYLPTVLAAHRWGYDNYSYEYRSKNLFLNVPNMQIGDEIKVVWYNETITYKVTKVEEGNYASQKSDLILITCKYYDSPLRYFVYASRVN